MQFPQVDRRGSGQAMLARESHEQLVLAQQGVHGSSSTRRTEHAFPPTKRADVQERQARPRLPKVRFCIFCYAN
ncbi:hypothetical protein AQJ58_33800 [Streptomyces sp. DSM 15324]|nr:hypothetical protein AQJ58_33800 [Streptomyces sp. DSM 15324]